MAPSRARLSGTTSSALGLVKHQMKINGFAHFASNTLRCDVINTNTVWAITIYYSNSGTIRSTVQHI